MKKFRLNFLHKGWAYKAIMLTSVGFLLASCGAQMGEYTETDGVYYDPNKDVIPESIAMNEGNRVDNYYNYDTMLEKSKQLEQAHKKRYQQWDSNQPNDSDWGTYAGTDRYYNCWNSSFYNGFGYDPYFYGNGWNIGFGMGYGYGWNSYFNMNWGYYPYGYGYNRWRNPYYYPYGGWYNPYWGGYYGYYGGYGWNPYYGYGYGYPYGGYVVVPRYEYRRSGASNYRSQGSGSSYSTPFRSGIRSNGQANDYRTNRSNQSYQSPNYQSSGRFRNAPMNSNSVRSNNNYQSQSNSSWNSSSRDSGFRSGSSSNSSSSSSRSSGGFRSGGFR